MVRVFATLRLKPEGLIPHKRQWKRSFLDLPASLACFRSICAECQSSEKTAEQDIEMDDQEEVAQEQGEAAPAPEAESDMKMET